MDLSKAPVFNGCVGHDWSPIGAAAGQSALAAVLAGFSFSAATVLLSVPPQNRNEDFAGRAVRLLFTAFFGLAVVSYLYSEYAGEQACPRAEIESSLTGGVLATSAVIMIVALTHLTAAYRREDTGLLGLLRGLVYTGSGFVILLLGTNSVTVINSDLDYGSHAGVSTALFAVSIVAAIAIGLWSWRVERCAKQGDADAGQGGAVRHCTWIALAYLAVAGSAAGIALSVPGRDYYPPPVWLVYCAAWSSMLLPLIVLALAIRAMARPPHSKPPDEAAAAA